MEVSNFFRVGLRMVRGGLFCCCFDARLYDRRWERRWERRREEEGETKHIAESTVTCVAQRMLNAIKVTQ